MGSTCSLCLKNSVAPAPTPIAKLFISYSWSYKPENVRKMAEYLKSRNFNVWLDIWFINGNLFQQMADAIDDSDLVIVFFSEKYTGKKTNSFRELQYAVQTNKTLLLVRLQSDYRPKGAFLVATGSELYVDYLTSNEIDTAGRNICNQIGLLLNKTIPDQTHPTAYHKRFELRKASCFSDYDYFPRPEMEIEILLKLTNICNNPEQGVLVVHGESGVGKATLISRILHYDPEEVVGVSLANPIVVFWVKCSEFTDKFDAEDKATFNRKLTEAARCIDSNFPSNASPSEIIAYFNSEKKRILFVLDDVVRVELLLHMLSFVQIDQLSCCIITQDPYDFVSTQRNVKVTTHKVDVLSNDEMKNLLKLLFEENRLSETQQADLVDCYCCGLPLIASLMKGRFDAFRDSRNPYGIVASSWDHYLQEERLFLGDYTNTKQTVIQYFRAGIERLGPELQRRYYAFLIFDPEPVAIKDLEPFWRTANGSIPEEIENRFLIAALTRRVETSIEDELFVHRMLYEAALEKAAEEFHISAGDREGRLQNIRSKLLTGEADNRSQSGEMVMFEAVRQHRLLLCQRLVRIVDGRTLAALVSKTSMKTGEMGRPFLNFLYHAGWPSQDTEYSESNAMTPYGINNSYRIIRAILLKLIRSLSLSEVSNVINLRANDGRSFLLDLFRDEQKVSQKLDRQQLVSLVSQWRTAVSQERWQADQASDLLLSSVISNNVDEVREKITALEGSDRRERAVNDALLTAAQCGNLEVAEYLCQEQSSILRPDLLLDSNGNCPTTLACISGSFEMVKLLHDKFPQFTNQGNGNGITPLIMAAYRGIFKIVKFITEKYPDSSTQKTTGGETALFYAAKNGHLVIARHLASLNSEMISQATNSGITPFIAACQNGHTEIVKHLEFIKPACLLYKKEAKPIAYACYGGHLEVVNFLAKKDPQSLQETTNRGLTPLMIACNFGHMDITEVLANPTTLSQIGPHGMTPIFFAIQGGHLEVVEFLANKDSECLTKRTDTGWSPMMLACQVGNLDVVKFLAEKDPNCMNDTNRAGVSAVTIASRHEHQNVVDFFAEKNSSFVPQTNFVGDTTMREVVSFAPYDSQVAVTTGVLTNIFRNGRR